MKNIIIYKFDQYKPSWVTWFLFPHNSNKHIGVAHDYNYNNILVENVGLDSAAPLQAARLTPIFAGMQDMRYICMYVYVYSDDSVWM